jgi:hypothetical protein
VGYRRVRTLSAGVRVFVLQTPLHHLQVGSDALARDRLDLRGRYPRDASRQGGQDRVRTLSAAAWRDGRSPWVLPLRFGDTPLCLRLQVLLRLQLVYPAEELLEQLAIFRPTRSSSLSIISSGEARDQSHP